MMAIQPCRRRQLTAQVVLLIQIFILLCTAYVCEGFVFPNHLYCHNHDGSAEQELGQSKNRRRRSLPRGSFHTGGATCFATIESSSSSAEKHDSGTKSGTVNPSHLLEKLGVVRDQAAIYAEQFDLTTPEAALYALCLAMRQTSLPLGLSGSPFLLTHEAIVTAYGGQTTEWPGFFTIDHLQAAVEEDFLDAARGSTDNRKGWQITDVSVPRGDSFQSARMTFEDVQNVLKKGTLILNAAGAHIPRLAGPTLACCDAMSLPCALNLYVTNPQMRTSAPPHTDQQDVLVIQTSGQKNWKVFNVPDPALKPQADIFKRGKGDDSLPLYSLLDSDSLLLETTLSPGDVLFIPAGFPHTTSTTVHPETTDEKPNSNDKMDDVSVHLTMGIDHHIWELDYISARRLAMRKAGMTDDFATHESINRMSNASLRARLLAELPLGLLEDDGAKMVPHVVETLRSLATELGDAADTISTWKETVERIRKQGTELLNIHRDMYLAAMDEGRARKAEAAMTAHLGKQTVAWTPDRLQRLSVFRVRRFYDQISSAKETLREWSMQSITSGRDAASMVQLDDPLSCPNWAFELPVKVGDSVEADLGGAWFAASVTRASGGTYDVAFFDGDRETNLPRDAIKLVNKPTASNPLTAKELKKKKERNRSDRYRPNSI